MEKARSEMSKEERQEAADDVLIAAFKAIASKKESLVTVRDLREWIREKHGCLSWLTPQLVQGRLGVFGKKPREWVSSDQKSDGGLRLYYLTEVGRRTLDIPSPQKKENLVVDKQLTASLEAKRKKIQGWIGGAPLPDSEKTELQQRLAAVDLRSGDPDAQLDAVEKELNSARWVHLGNKMMRETGGAFPPTEGWAQRLVDCHHRLPEKETEIEQLKAQIKELAAAKQRLAAVDAAMPKGKQASAEEIKRLRKKAKKAKPEPEEEAVATDRAGLFATVKAFCRTKKFGALVGAFLISAVLVGGISLFSRSSSLLREQDEAEPAVAEPSRRDTSGPTPLERVEKSFRNETKKQEESQ